jgi:hypothetical protein
MFFACLDRFFDLIKTKGQQTCWPLKINQKTRQLFCRCAQTPRADTHPVGLPAAHQSYLVDIGFPLPLGVAHRVAYTIPTHRLFTTNVALSHSYHLHLSFNKRPPPKRRGHEGVSYHTGHELANEINWIKTSATTLTRKGKGLR